MKYIRYLVDRFHWWTLTALGLLYLVPLFLWINLYSFPTWLWLFVTLAFLYLAHTLHTECARKEINDNDIWTETLGEEK